MPNCKFYGGRKQATPDESLFLSLSAVLKKSAPGKFAYTCHLQQIGINASKIEKAGIHFKTDGFAAVAVVDAKAPNCREGEPRRPAETAQKGSETKWEGLVTILSLVSNLPKKVIPQKRFGRPPSEPKGYHCKITQSTGVAAQCNSRSSIPAAT